MPDIFGKNPSDYEFVRRLQADDQWEPQQRAYAAQRGNKPYHNFNALGSGAPNGYLRAEEEAQAFGFLTDNLLAIQTMVDEVLYVRNRLPDLIHLNTAIPEGATSYSVRVMDYAGRGGYITGDGTDAPNATAAMRLVPHRVDYAGIDANWTVEDLRNAMFAGVPLDSESLEAATRGALNHMEEVALLGDAARGTTGLCNLPITGRGKVTRNDAGSKFLAGPGATTRNLINDEISALIEDTNEVFGDIITDMLCVYLPVKQYNLLSTRFIGEEEDRSIMRALLEDNAWTHRTGSRPMFKSVQELKGVAANNKDRMVTACKDRRVCEVGVSISPRVIRIMDKGRTHTAQVEYKFSPLFVKRPDTIRYLDGI